MRPATPINVIKITTIGIVDDETTGKRKVVKKNKHSLSMSPIRNTLAKYKEKFIGGMKEMSRQTDSRYDSTQESLNIEAYMQNNSTLAIEEVDEDDYIEYPWHEPKENKPLELPSITRSPKTSGFELKSKTAQNLKHKIGTKKFSAILLEDNSPRQKWYNRK